MVASVQTVVFVHAFGSSGRALQGLARVDVRGRLGEVAVPTLDACGARDRANLGPSREIAAGVPGAELRIVPDAVHLWNLQQPGSSTRPWPSSWLRSSDQIRSSGADG